MLQQHFFNAPKKLTNSSFFPAAQVPVSGPEPVRISEKSPVMGQSGHRTDGVVDEVEAIVVAVRNKIKVD